MNFLLDTCVVSELVRPAPSAAVTAWIDRCDESTLYLSVLTLGELHKGIARLPAGNRRNQLTQWVEHDLAERFGGRILPVDATVASVWGELCGLAAVAGKPLPVIDSLLAATSQTHRMTIATRNVADFARCAIDCFNPWEYSPT